MKPALLLPAAAAMLTLAGCAGSASAQAPEQEVTHAPAPPPTSAAQPPQTSAPAGTRAGIAQAALEREFRVMERLAADPSVPVSELEAVVYTGGKEWDESRDQVNGLRNNGSRMPDLRYSISRITETGRYTDADRIEVSVCIRAQGTLQDAYGETIQAVDDAAEHTATISSRDLTMAAVFGSGVAAGEGWKVFSTVNTQRPC